MTHRMLTEFHSDSVLTSDVVVKRCIKQAGIDIFTTYLVYEACVFNHMRDSQSEKSKVQKSLSTEPITSVPKVACLSSTSQQVITHSTSSIFPKNFRVCTICLNLGDQYRLRKYLQAPASSGTSDLSLSHRYKTSEQMSRPAPS